MPWKPSQARAILVKAKRSGDKSLEEKAKDSLRGTNFRPAAKMAAKRKRSHANYMREYD